MCHALVLRARALISAAATIPAILSIGAASQADMSTENKDPTSVLTSSCRRHEAVPGFIKRANDVIVCGDVDTARSHVLFFGGDVQDYPEKMLNHRDHKKYNRWNLESTAELLARRFPESVIFVIKPVRMHLNTFSVYSNFVESNDFGCPTHQFSYTSWSHVMKLHRNVLEKEVHTQATDDSSCAIDHCSSAVPVKIIGFSKGCIVLNQMLYDLQLAEEDKETKSFIGRVEEFYWLDGGHSGGSETWICDKDVLKNLCKLKTKVIVHVTPYQVSDPMRAWVGREQRKFVSNLKKLGVDVTETMHFEDLSRSIENHFQVLESF